MSQKIILGAIMDNSLIFDLIEIKLLKYREQIEKENAYLKDISEAREKLEKSLSTEQFELVKSYGHTLLLREEDIELQCEIKLLHYGIKIGMQMQKAFDED